MKHNNILVIIVSFNSMKWAERCYNSLRASTVPCDVLTVDNGSTDGTQEYIRTNFPEVELIETGANLGFGRANNIGLQKVLDEGYDYCYLLNQDAWVEPDTFEKLLAVSDKHPDYGILSPMQMKADCQHFDGNFIKNVLLSSESEGSCFAEDAYFNHLEDVYEVDFVMAAHWFITRRCLETIGGFSPTFPHYGEDSNLIHRAQYWKYKAGIVPASKAVHDRGDANWSVEKQIYIKEYIGDLIGFSNPFFSPKSRWLSLVRKCLISIIFGNKIIRKYNIRLLKERNIVLNNYRLSLIKKAFLVTIY